MDPLITLSQLKSASGEFTNPDAPSPQDGRFENAIASASMLIRAYTGLKFEVSNSSVASTRSFEYDGSGYLDIDEAQTITGITAQAGFEGAYVRSLTTYEWGAYPLNLPVKLWLRMPRSVSLHGRISPEMGFTYNLDTIGDYYGEYDRPTILTVTAVWGWTEIPADVQQAALWTALSIAETPRPFQQESIESYSRTRGADASSEPIPERALAALQSYVIPQV